MRPRDVLAFFGLLALLFLGLGIVLILIGATIPSLKGCVGVIEVTGTLSTTGGYDTLSSGEYVELIKEAEKRPDVKGILLEINSPGGSVVASREIYSTLKSVQKPVVAYIDEEGASGGYFVAVGAPYIMADPASVTGSIGARATFYDLSTLLSNLGINSTVIKSGEMKDIGDYYRPMTDEEKSLLQGLVNEIFEDFKTTVKTAREGNPRFSDSNFTQILDARILTGKQAFEIGLVDALGTREDARSYIGKQVGLGPDPSICMIQKKRSLLTDLFNALGRGVGESFLNIPTRISIG